jgi:predicted nucleotidyltransferase
MFGSVVRGEATETTEVDVLVDCAPGRDPLDQVGLVQGLEELLGVKVHAGTERSLHWYVRDRILAEAIPL